jgi:hypothetical protein
LEKNKGAKIKQNNKTKIKLKIMQDNTKTYHWIIKHLSFLQAGAAQTSKCSM